MSATNPTSRLPVLSVCILGPVRATVGRRPVRLRSRKCQAVLACLALKPSKCETREHLVGLLWSESDEARARASLRQILHELFESLSDAGYHGLTRERLQVGLAGNAGGLDYHAALALAAEGQAHPSLLDAALPAETLLQDLDDIDPAFRAWLQTRRQTLHANLVQALEAGLHDPATPAAAQQLLAQAIVNLEPTHEGACRALMRRFAEDGEISSALRTYSALWHLLDQEYDMEPSTPTQQLVADIKRGLIPPSHRTPAIVWPAHARPPGPAPRSGVLPLYDARFRNGNAPAFGPA